MTPLPMIGYAALDDFRTQTFARRLSRLALRWLALAGSGVVLLALFIGLFQLFAVGVLTGVLAVLGCVLCTSVAATCVRAARYQRAWTVLNYCEQGMRLAMPLPNFLSAVADNESPRMARRIRTIVSTLEAPAPLASALRSELPELPSRISEVLRLAEANGTLPVALTRLVEEERPPSSASDLGAPIPLAYLAVVGTCLIIPAIFVAEFVMPKFAEIYRDFGIPIPATWLALYAVDWRITFSATVAVALISLVLLTGVLARNARHMYFRRLEFDQPFKPLIDRILWHSLLIGAQIRDRDRADVCQSIADGLAHHRPFDALLREAASPHLNAVTFDRLDRWHAYVTEGNPIGMAARSAHMPRLIVGLISNATSDGLAPTFAFLARHYRGHAVQRGAWLAAAVMPALTIVCGAAVTAFALFLWLPICRLIDGTLPYPTSL